MLRRVEYMPMMVCTGVVQKINVGFLNGQNVLICDLGAVE